jgi:hypothetical protein
VKRLVLTTLVFAAGCATTPETTPDGTSKTPAAETPEVPYTPTTVSEPAPAPTPTNTTTPAAGGQQPAPAPQPEAPAPPPAPAFDPETQSRFKEGVTALNQGNADAAEAAFKDVLSRNNKAAYAWTNLGVIEERRGDFSDATSSWSVRQPTTLGCLPRSAVNASVTLVVRL